MTWVRTAWRLLLVLLLVAGLLGPDVPTVSGQSVDDANGARPTTTKPTDAKPTDAKPTDAKPTDAKPTDAKPPTSARRPSSATLITSAFYTARFDGSQLVDGTARLTVGPTVRAFHSLPLAPLSLSITESVRGGAAPDGKWWAATDQEGVIEFLWRHPPQTVSDEFLEFAIELPVCPQTRLQLTLPNEWRPVIADAVMEASDEAGSRRWTVDLGARQAFRLRLVRRAAARRPATYKNRTEIRLGPGRVDITGRIEIDGDLYSDRIRLKADSRLTLLDAVVDGRACEIATESMNGGTQTYLVLLPSDVTRAKSVRVTAIGPLPRTPTWIPPRILPMELEWASESLTLIAEQSVSVAPASLTNAAHVRTQSTVDDGLEMDFRFFRDTARVRLRVEERRPELLFDAITSLQFAQDHVQGRCDVEVRALWGEVFEIEFPKPSQWIIDKVESTPPGLLENGGGSWEVIQDRSGDRLVIHLARPISPQRSAGLIIEGTRQVVRDNRTGRIRAILGRQLRLLRFPNVPHVRHRLALSATAPHRLRLLDDAHLDRVIGTINETDRERLLSASADILVRDGPGFDSTRITTELSPDEVDADLHVRVDVEGSKLVETYHGLVTPTTRTLQTITMDLTVYRKSPVEWFVDGKAAVGQRLIDDKPLGNATEKWSVEVGQTEVKPIVIVGRRETEFRGEELDVALAYVHQAKSRGVVSVHSATTIEFIHQGLERVPVVPTQDDARDHRGEFEYTAVPPPRLTVRRTNSNAQDSLAWAIQNRLISEFSPDGRVLHTADFWVNSNGRREIAMTLPSTALALQLSVDGEIIPLVVRSEGRVVCPLPSRYTTSHIRLVYRTFGTRMRFRSDYQREFVKTDFPSPAPHWYVAIPHEWGVWAEQRPSSRLLLKRLLGPVVDESVQRRRDAVKIVESALRESSEPESERQWKDLFLTIDRSLNRAWGGRLQIDRVGLAEVGLRPTDPLPDYAGGDLIDWLQRRSLGFALIDDNSLIVTSQLGMSSRRGSEISLRLNHRHTVGLAYASEGSDVPADRWEDVSVPEWTLPHPIISRQRIVYDMETLATADHLVVYHMAQIGHIAWGILFISMGFVAWLFRGRSPSILLAACTTSAAIALLVPVELAPLGAACFVGVVFGCVISRLRQTVVVPPVSLPRQVALILLLVGILDGPVIAQPPEPNERVKASEVDTELRVAPDVGNPDRLRPNGLPTWHIRSATYRWMGDADPPRLIVEFQIQRVAPAGVIALGFRQSEVTPLRVTQDDRAIGFDWQRNGDGLLLYLTKAGSSRLKLELLVASDDGREYLSSIPRVAHSRFLDASLQERFALDEAILGENGWADVGPRAKLRIVRISDMTDLNIDEVTHVNIRPESLTVQSRFEFDPQRQMIRALRFECSPELRLVNPAQEDQIAEIESLGGVDPLVYEIRLIEPTQEPFHLNLTFHLRDRSGTGRITVPRVRWMQGMTQIRTLALDYSDDMLVEGVDVAWTELEPALVDALWQPNETAPKQAFRAKKSDSLFSFFSELVAESVTVEDDWVASVGSRNVAFTYSASVTPGGRPVSLHQIQTPRGMSIDQLTVVEDNVEYLARHSLAVNGVVTVYLPEPTDKPHRLQLAGRLDLSSMTSAHSINRIRFVSAQSVNSQIRIYRRTDASNLEFEIPETWSLPTEWDADSDPLDWSWELGRLTSRYEVVDDSPTEFEQPIVVRVIERKEHDLAELVIRVDRDSGSWMTTCDLMVQHSAADSKTDVVQLRIPEQWQGPFQITPTAKVELREHGKGQRTLVVIPARPLEGDFRYRITGQWVESDRRLRVPDILPLNMEIQGRYVDLPKTVDQQSVGWQLLNLTPVSAASLPGTGNPVSTSRTVSDRLVCRATGRSFEASLDRIRSRGGYPLVRLADVTLSIDAVGEFYGTLVLDVEPAGEMDQLSLGLPKGLDIDAVRIGNSLTVPIQSDGRIQLGLHSKELPQRIEIRFHGVWDESDYRLAVPQVIGTPVARTLWTVTGRQLQNLEHVYPDAVIRANQQKMERLLALHTSLEMSRDRLLDVQPAHARTWYERWLVRLAGEYRELAGDLSGDVEKRQVQLASVVEGQQELASLFDAEEAWRARLVTTSDLTPSAIQSNSTESAVSTSEMSWRLAFSGSQASLTLNTAVSTGETVGLRWLCAAALLLVGVTLFLLDGQLELWLLGALPNWPALVVAVVGLIWGALLTPATFSVALVSGALLLARPRKWPGALRRFRRTRR